MQNWYHNLNIPKNFMRQFHVKWPRPSEAEIVPPSNDWIEASSQTNLGGWALGMVRIPSLAMLHVLFHCRVFFSPICSLCSLSLSLSISLALSLSLYLSLPLSLALNLIDSEAMVWCCPSRTWQWFYIHTRISCSSKRYTSTAPWGIALGRDSMLLAPGFKTDQYFMKMIHVFSYAQSYPL